LQSRDIKVRGSSIKDVLAKLAFWTPQPPVQHRLFGRQHPPPSPVHGHADHIAQKRPKCNIFWDPDDLERRGYLRRPKRKIFAQISQIWTSCLVADPPPLSAVVHFWFTPPHLSEGVSLMDGPLCHVYDISGASRAHPSIFVYDFWTKTFKINYNTIFLNSFRVFICKMWK